VRQFASKGRALPENLLKLEQFGDSCRELTKTVRAMCDLAWAHTTARVLRPSLEQRREDNDIDMRFAQVVSRARFFKTHLKCKSL
jgi:hypothetical protein